MVVSIILSILKIIGITLLCVLGLILFVLIVVLFVPIRYKVTADSNINENEKEYHVKVSVSWFLHLVHGKLEYPKEDGFVLKVGPFTIYGKKKKVKVKTEKLIEQETPKNNDVLKPILKEEVEEKEEKIEEIEKSKHKSLKEKILYTRQKIYDKINKIRRKIKDILTNIKKYVGIIESEEFKESFSLCKDSLIRLFCMIKPRKVKIRGTAGLGSPDKTGYMCAAIGTISPFFKKQIQVVPDFEKYVIEGKALIKGRIYLFVVLIIMVKLFFDKNIRKVIDMFQKEDV